MMLRHCSWPKLRASATVSSETSSAPASTITMASSLAGDDDVQQAGLLLRDGRIGDELAIEQADAHSGDRRGERQIGDERRGGSAGDGDDVGIVLAVGGKNRGDDLRFVAPGFGKQRAHRAVDQARRQNFALRGAAFALEEAAGNFARGIGVLAIVDGERQKIAVIRLWNPCRR